jgi:hypothetical protein
MLVWQGVIDGNQQKFWTKMFCEMALFKAVIRKKKPYVNMLMKLTPAYIRYL